MDTVPWPLKKLCDHWAIVRWEKLKSSGLSEPDACAGGWNVPKGSGCEWQDPQTLPTLFYGAHIWAVLLSTPGMGFKGKYDTVMDLKFTLYYWRRKKDILIPSL